MQQRQAPSLQSRASQAFSWSSRLAPTGLRRYELWWALFFLTPTVGSVLVFTVFPIFFALYMSFHEWSVIGTPQFIGAANYVEGFTSADFLRALRNTAQFVIGYVPGTIVTSLFFALLLHQNVRGRSLYRMLYFLPTVVSIVVIAEVWNWIYEPRYGLINYYLGQLGFSDTIPWLASPKWAMWAIVLMSVWKSTGYYMILYIAGLSGINPELYDAAAIDGAGNWSMFWRVTLPLLKPTTFFIITMLIISAFQIFGQIYVMTEGGPAGSTSVIMWVIYTTAFRNLRMGYASALSYVLFVILFSITLLQWRGWGREAVDA
jgi:multiple sugar transport system permease protein